MKTSIWTAKGRVEVRDIDEPLPAPDELEGFLERERAGVENTLNRSRCLGDLRRGSQGGRSHNQHDCNNGYRFHRIGSFP